MEENFYLPETPTDCSTTDTRNQGVIDQFVSGEWNHKPYYTVRWDEYEATYMVGLIEDITLYHLLDRRIDIVKFCYLECLARSRDMYIMTQLQVDRLLSSTHERSLEDICFK